ncbi:MAG TPA: peptidoglycan -binding protein [Acetobacteraceae bacterium]|jgi:chemotaxis protein MotB|nr:peptidoglycan -binding protein [Acetobacteraceae bacterium]
MPASTRRRGDNGLNAWPGYVDALSTLLMVIIFVLLVFVLAQAFLSVTLSDRDKQLDLVNRQLSELANMLSLERNHAAELQVAVAQLNQQVTTGNDARAALTQSLSVAQGQLAQANQTRDQLAAQLAEAQSQLADAKARATAAEQQIATNKQASDAARAQLSTQVDQLKAQVADANARAAADKQFSDSARAQIALLAAQVEQLKAQLAAVARALDLAVTEGRDKDAQIANLGQRLNAALAAKVEELQQYRSEFFGKLRQVLANRPGISIVGDRFVFQSEVLFPVGSADLTDAGAAQMDALAATIKQIMPEIPANIHWILQVNGFTDSQPIKGGPYPTNWELSAARAITVVKLLTADGVPPQHLAATGFSDYQPLDPADTPEAYARNRRIELRLTDR